MLFAALVLAVAASVAVPGESQVPANEVCWSAYTFNDDGTERRVGSGRIVLHPGATKQEKDRARYFAVQRAFRRDATRIAPMSQSLRDIEPDRLMCKVDCGGTGVVTYPGAWSMDKVWCFSCLGTECEKTCKPTKDHKCPPGC